MAADQRKKRMNSVNIVACSQDRNGSKKRKQGISEYGFRMRCNVSLVWDEKKKRVVSKGDQIGMSWRDFMPFSGSVPRHHNILADVLNVPHEIFDLDNLAEVLTPEVWQTCLSHTEQSLLSEYLPKGIDADKLVHDLLRGDNFLFGNPFHKWSYDLCSGNLHPDAITSHRQSIKSHKKTYYLELQKYHASMIDNLKTWKDKWASCKDSDEEIVEIIWRSTKFHRKRGHSLELDAEENFVRTPEFSWAAGDKGFSSDSPNPSVLQGDTQRRKVCVDNQYGNSLDWNNAAKHKRGEQIQKRNIQQIDGSKYMSYIKVSKEHYERVKSSMTHSSNSIQSRSLNNVLGNIKNLHVKPFEAYEEEERQKLHEHWLQLANRDLPAHYSNWLKRQSQECQLRQSIGHEMEELKPLSQDSMRVFHHLKSLEMKSNEATNIAPTLTAQAAKDDEEATSNKFLLHQTNKNSEDHISSHVSVEEDEIDKPVWIAPEKIHHNTVTIKGDSWSSSISQQHQHVQQIVSLSDTNQFNEPDLDLRDDDIKKMDKESPSVFEKLNKDAPLNQGSPLSSNSNNVWPIMSGVPFSSTPLNIEYSACVELPPPLSHPHVMDGRQDSHLIEVHSCEKEIVKDTLHRESSTSFYSHCPNETLQPFIKSNNSSGSVHNKQEQSSLTFHSGTTNLMSESGQFSGHFKEHNPALVLKQAGLSDLYMQHQSALGNEYSVGGGPYSFPQRQGNLNIAIPDWNMNVVRFPAVQSTNLNGDGDLGQSWFSGENRARGGWSSLESRVGPPLCISGNDSDQSLFSVVSECNELRRGISSYDTMGPTERFMFAGNYDHMGLRVMSGPNNSLQATAINNPLLTYLSSHEGSGGRPTNSNMGWVNNVANQNSGFIG
ncbi:unnamed protein product [Cuscuta epithymum]|uniref:DEUBAD domain-containing protein n=1 Tax=Cuscuta epithymum TaxID=186058 RepID=A0AAV0D3Q7_9ASTE|nr:unnamed protein product [Cuscuta epithymum]